MVSRIALSEMTFCWTLGDGAVDENHQEQMGSRTRQEMLRTSNLISKIAIPSIAWHPTLNLPPASKQGLGQPKGLAANGRTSCYQIVCPRSGKALATASSEC